jgi:branched-chain amino acid transport system ATP-binding protein
MTLLELKGVTTCYGKVEAVKRVNLHLEKEEVVVIIGANGAGKSTILRTISGLQRPVHGEIWFLGRRIDGLPPHDITKLGISHVPERRRLFPRLSVLDNLKLGAYLQKDKREIRKSLDEVVRRLPILSERKDQLAGTLSGGEQQMLAIGRALMSNPKLLLMDEPSLGLAPLVVREIGKIIRDLHNLGRPIILVEQNAQLALRLADRGYVLETGKIVLEGRSEDLLRSDLVKRAYLGNR